ncbi:hypothetical protein [Mucilaginibacter celer]|uniref:Uncharacterized protein n=1 Tax=Mucilaginibacter celer TaxID=2305508 RepID=A0A494VPA0_9SPHI|nr:hypothetical protein [Mucilaginibacter celer]AYL96554.1 hypothetical protein HYN43_015145 [Mucilaginibacter celer]
METLVINIPDNKSVVVKQILKELGVTIQQESHSSVSNYRERLSQVSEWSEEDLKVFDETKKAFESPYF